MPSLSCPSPSFEQHPPPPEIRAASSLTFPESSEELALITGLGLIYWKFFGVSVLFYFMLSSGHFSPSCLCGLGLSVLKEVLGGMDYTSPLKFSGYNKLK